RGGLKGDAPPARPAGQTSGRRLALARWLTDETSPAGALVLRVRVNRVWQRLFGRGIVATSDNFGVTGAPPTHVELLEWLACEYAETGGRLKPLVRLMVTSSVYRQASAVAAEGSDGPALNANAANVDPDNDRLWRQRLRRLESEAVRDAMLAAGGKLVGTLGGPPVMTQSRADGYVGVVEEGPAGRSGPWRRSLYLLQRRNYHPTLLAVFDQPTLATNCTCRTPSAVVLQSLAMLNDEFVADRASEIARRAATENTIEQQVERAFLMVLGRPPREGEAGPCAALVERHSLATLCHVLLNTSEFLYIP
ncbi:MAG: DUF1553 domain-containing protein, partial [Planctomycetia bacterium]|nr:DUF1553 domain-containing protein [Planctomycetia bacterium]